MRRQPKTRFGWIDYAEMNRAVSGHLRQLGVSLWPEDPVLGLSIADQQIVEIIKALTFEAKVLILDEPTAGRDGGRYRFCPVRSPTARPGNGDDCHAQRDANIIAAEDLGNPAIPEGFAKYTTDLFDTPVEPGQVHLHEPKYQRSLVWNGL